MKSKFNIYLTFVVFLLMALGLALDFIEFVVLIVILFISYSLFQIFIWDEHVKNKRNCSGILYSSGNNLSDLISMVMAADGKSTKEEYNKVCSFLESNLYGSTSTFNPSFWNTNGMHDSVKLYASDYRSIVEGISIKLYNQSLLKYCAKTVYDMYKHNEPKLYFISELLYNVVTCNGGITASEWLCMCEVMNIFYPNDSDFLYFVEKYADFVVEKKPYYARYVRCSGEKKSSFSKKKNNGQESNGEKEQSGGAQQENVNEEKKRYYALLGVSSDATKDEIRRAFHLLARKYHPDTTQDAVEIRLLTEKFMEIQDAYEKLICSKK